MKDQVYETLGKIFTVLLAAFFISLVFALPVKWLWNATMPELFNFKEIDWWMAWKLTMLIGFMTPVKSVTNRN